MGKSCLRTVLTAILLSVLAGCGKSEADAHKEAIERVLAADKAISNRLKAGLAADSSQRDALLATACAESRSIELDECPVDFREAYVRNINAAEAFALVVKIRNPTSGWDQFWRGFSNGLNHQTTGQNADDDQSEILKSLADLHKSWTEVEVLATRYGAKLPPKD